LGNSLYGFLIDEKTLHLARLFPSGSAKTVLDRRLRGTSDDNVISVTGLSRPAGKTVVEHQPGVKAYSALLGIIVIQSIAGGLRPRCSNRCQWGFGPASART